jgi:peptidylprolyl isomerase
MAHAKKGDTVRVHYTGKLDDGTVFDTSRERHPLQFTLGNGQVISGFESAVTGMNVGESKTTIIPMEQAYGPRRDDMIVIVKRDQLPPDLSAKVGQRLEITQTNNQVVLVTVTGVSESSITLDSNHPLAGKTLTFDLELLEIVS